jgi:predicted DNA-binding protein (UPF0251 family)
MRPKKTRWIKCDPGERCFRPRCRPAEKLQGVILTLDEFEALRLFDLQKLDQHAIALKMNVHRSTISRILASARTKITDALVNLKAIKVEGGCCEIHSKKITRGADHGK